ncbi:MAG: M48 family metalloprotease [Terriglobales bacterium]
MEQGPQHAPSLAGRAFLAVVLSIGFYVLAVVVAVVLFWIPYAEWQYAHRLHIKLAVVCVLGGLAVLWSILPRVDRFQAPGSELKAAEHPKLFREIQDIARVTGQTTPANVYLVPEVNAWVAQRGGLLGLGSHRVMGLGLPLLQVLNISQLRAVLAHEFGHFHGGDTMLGPWIYKTRNAIRRTVWTLSDEGGQATLLSLPFLWYSNLFLGVTQAISRRQELAADQLAARTVGAQHMIEGLRVVHATGPLADSYWQGEVAVVVDSGYRPPLAQGFSHFMNSDLIRKETDALVEAQARTRKGDKYDSHPPLGERIDQLTGLPGGGGASCAEPAISLLDTPESAERELLEHLLGEERARALKPLRWEDSGEQVWIPRWRSAVSEARDRLRGLTPAMLPEALPRFSAFLGYREGMPAAEEVQKHLRDAQVVSCGLALALHQAGHPLRCLPGGLFFECDGQRLDPFAVLRELYGGKLSAEEWKASCVQLRIADLRLENLVS